jgi:putative ABC transport system substrate-binding protein
LGSSPEIDKAVPAAVAEGAQAILVANDAFFLGQRDQFARLASKYRVALMSSFLEEAQAGALVSYGPNNRQIYRRAAAYVDKILKGQSPGALAVEQPTEIELVFNQRTAKAIGLTIPTALLLRADKVLD